ncbi:hypothetical protein CYMTET_51860 [Cymbomonas tetramitiformis]|uniref:CCHC-type domain-containing protein n=1 Tax=Cymbomonas tetramitiformis TaxID=36881 RepID=A0AAE0BK92_9CHLO|nr:hypothetical protein CYMTET_51860 [Cymbomonas tetramitiformis]
MAAVDPSDGFTTPVPAGIDTRRALPFSDGPEEPVPPTPVKHRPLAGDETGGAVIVREFLKDCQTILREPGHRASIIQQVRDQCRPTHIKASEWVFDIDKIKGQVPREIALDRFSQAVKTQLTDFNLQFATVFHPTDLTTTVLPEATRILYRILTSLVRGSCLRLVEESATVSPDDGRRAWLVICGAVARRRRPWVSHGYLFETAPAIELLEDVDPEPYIKGFMQHHTAIRSELRPGVEPDDVWGVGFALDLLTLRMCPLYYKDLLQEWSSKTAEGREKRALGIQQFTLAGYSSPRQTGPRREESTTEHEGAQEGLSPFPSCPSTADSGAAAACIRWFTDCLAGDTGCTAGRHTVQCWDCGGPHFRRDCPGGVQSAHVAGFHPEATPIADILSELDAAFLDPEEEVYESCLYSYSLELGEAPLDLPAAQAAAVVPHSAVDSEEPWTESEWAIWDSCGR